MRKLRLILSELNMDEVKYYLCRYMIGILAMVLLLFGAFVLGANSNKTDAIVIEVEKSVPTQAPEVVDDSQSSSEEEPITIDEDAQYVGSVDSDKFHCTTCRYADSILPENLIIFESIAQAQEEGYLPCGVCNPLG